ncbi:MmcQ/YjbR family DNA-binding protein [Kribbella endophytica]
MADQDDVRRLALALPEVTENDDRFAFSIGKKGIAWVWLERPAPKAPRVPNPSVLAIRVAGESGKQDLLAADPTKFFTEPHYNGFPAILVHLNAVDEAELRELLTDAWRLQAPKPLVKQHPDL